MSESKAMTRVGISRISLGKCATEIVLVAIPSACETKKKQDRVGERRNVKLQAQC